MIIVKTAKPTIIALAIVCLLVSTTIPLASQEMVEQPHDIWTAQPMYISPFVGSLTPIGYTPNQIRTAYNLPASGGKGTIAIIDAYHTPNILDAFNTFSNQFGLPNNSTGNLIVYTMGNDTDSDWAMETCLDVEWAHAIAPDAKILLVEAANNGDVALLSAIDYATSQPDVVAVSMSWGAREFYQEANSYYETHFNKPGITFFASSGDDGRYVYWPAASSSVVSVGGTTLNLNPDSSVSSEIAWQGSSGGISTYFTQPDYQSNFGLAYTHRAVPDVSYNGNPSTGFAVYNGTWWQVGGTSAGAPQWAAIHSLTLSATNTNIYERAEAAYSSYFRDIVLGSNYVNFAEEGYDLVTGLGSPLDINFAAEISITPTAGPAGAAITISGSNFIGSSVNLAYFNPVNNSWVSIANNTATTAGNFNFATTAPDLLQNSTAGDNPQLSDNIIFRAVDNSNGYAYNTAVPYVEYRRGLVQLGDIAAEGVFGNGTDLSSEVLVQSGDDLPISGRWFNPSNGLVSLLWDGVNVASTSVDAIGSFATEIAVPATPVGKHTLTIDAGAANFTVNLSRVPIVANDYNGQWHTNNFTITLTPDSAVNETFYRINGGTILNVTANGQPVITTEGASNTLEYWSAWNLTYNSLIELPHITVTGIKLDKTAPTGSITPSVTETQTTQISIALSAEDALSGEAQMRFANDDGDWTSWEPYATTKTWVLTNGDGAKTVSVQYMDNAGVVSVPYSCTVNLQLPQATQNPYTSTAPTTSPTTIPSPEPTSTVSPTDMPITQPTVPEFSFVWVLLLIGVSTALVLAGVIKKRQTQ
ncbi:MAG: S53 family peptidase [Candidatus Bathyarchaeia archaeon]|jgi:hypothetical protein